MFNCKTVQDKFVNYINDKRKTYNEILVELY